MTVCIRKENSDSKSKKCFQNNLNMKNFPVMPFETKINANFKSFKPMLLLQCYHNITSYSHHCEEMLSLITTFVYLKAYWRTHL